MDELQRRTNEHYNQILLKEYAPQGRELEKILASDSPSVIRSVNGYDKYKNLDYISPIFNSGLPDLIFRILKYYQENDKKKMGDLRMSIETPSPTWEIMDEKCRIWRNICFRAELLVVRLHERKEKSTLEDALWNLRRADYENAITRFATDPSL